MIARKYPGLHADHLVARYDRIRKPRVMDRDPASIRNVFVLSRVTLGADVAVTSVVLDAAKRAFPNADICFAGPQKSWELFAADPRLGHLAIAYGRGGTIDDRLSVWPQLREAVSLARQHYHRSRFPAYAARPASRSAPRRIIIFSKADPTGQTAAHPLSPLARAGSPRRSVSREARPYISTGLDAAEFATTVSFGVGENPAKRVARPFEAELLAAIAPPDSDR